MRFAGAAAAALAVLVGAGCVHDPGPSGEAIDTADLATVSLLNAPIDGLDRAEIEVGQGDPAGSGRPSSARQHTTVAFGADPAAVAVALLDVAAEAGVQWSSYSCTPRLYLTGGQSVDGMVANVVVEGSDDGRAFTIRIESFLGPPGSYTLPEATPQPDCPADLTDAVAHSGRGG